MVRPLLKTVWQLLTKLNMYVSSDTTISLPHRNVRAGTMLLKISHRRSHRFQHSSCTEWVQTFAERTRRACSALRRSYSFMLVPAHRPSLPDSGREFREFSWRDSGLSSVSEAIPDKSQRGGLLSESQEVRGSLDNAHHFQRELE